MTRTKKLYFTNDDFKLEAILGRKDIFPAQTNADLLYQYVVFAEVSINQLKSVQQILS